jgi:ribosomal protein S18 acetylase RimI-like enzyme
VQQWIDREDADYIVAELDGRVVGFVNIECASHPDAPVFRPREFAHIENAVVCEALRGKGIGHRLFDAVVAWAKERGLQHVQVSVWHENEGAREFYLSQGFRPITVRMELDTEPNAEP